MSIHKKISLFIISLIIFSANKAISQSVVDLDHMTYRELCELTKQADLPDLLELEFQQRDDPCVVCSEDSSEDSSEKTKTDVQQPLSHEIIENKINIRGDRPIGGLTYVDYKYVNDLERIDFTVDFKTFDKSQNVYVQFYQSQIGDNGFYFGIQNRVHANDHFLLFSMWFNDLDIAKSVGILDAPECAHFKEMKYDQKIKVFKLFFRSYPHKYKVYKEYALNCVKANRDIGAYVQASINELSFVGIRLPNFHISQGDKYNFSIVRESDDHEGTWYQYLVKNVKTGTETYVGSIRFKQNAKIYNHGSTWVEIFTPLKQKAKRPDGCQYYEDLPEIDLSILPNGDMEHPNKLKLNYGKNKSLIPQQNVDVLPNEKKFDIQIGPLVQRRGQEQVYEF